LKSAGAVLMAAPILRSASTGIPVAGSASTLPTGGGFRPVQAPSSQSALLGL
jgi:hypothetical protein